MRAQDITERRRTEVALRSAKVEDEKLIGELRSALQSVKTFSGLLPICMHCKKIRNDTGGMCGECARMHHAEFFPGDPP
jgi:hypothetical protein